MSKVTVNKKTHINISVSNRSGLIQPLGTAELVLNNQTTDASPQTLAALTDINLTEAPPLDTSMLVYNAITNKYDVKIANIDGGSF